MTSNTAAPIRLVYDVVPVPEQWYLDDDVLMPVTPAHDKRAETMRSTFAAHIRRAELDASAGANVALRWDREHPRVGVDPDVYWVEPALLPGTKSILTWKKGCAPPRVAVEIVSEDNAEKDYTDGPAKYAASGTKELWVFDPERFGPALAGGPYVLQLWRRGVKGQFKRVYAGDGPAFSRELGVWLVVVGDLLRVSNDAAGRDLWPTIDEERAGAEASAANERKAREGAEASAANERKAREGAEASAANERRAREGAEARLRALEAELARTKGGAKKPRGR